MFTESSSAHSKPSLGGFLSVKKESELLEVPKAARDIIQVHNIVGHDVNKSTSITKANHAAAAAAAKAALDAARKSLQQGSTRRSVDSVGEHPDANGNAEIVPGKTPPDPIVTISKVSGGGGIPGKCYKLKKMHYQ